MPGLDDAIREAAARFGEHAIPSRAADALARQLNAVTPWHVRVEVKALPGCVVTKLRSLRWLAWSQGVEPVDDLEVALVNVLYDVQGFIANRSQIAWPSAKRLTKHDHGHDPLTWDSELPEPDVAIEDGEVRLWFGDRRRPVLELEPISLH